MSFGKIFTSATFAIFCTVANAGTFNTNAYGGGVENLSDKISDIVTERFTQAFDAKSYSIVVIFQHDQVGQDNICTAITGVSRRPAQAKQTIQIPAWRLTVTNVQRNSGSLDYARKEACLLTVIRAAVQDLMHVEPEAIRSNSARSL